MTDDDAKPALVVADEPQLHTVGRVVDLRIRKWQRDLLWGGPAAQAASLATLARLRRGAGKPAGSVPDILAFSLAPEFVGRHDSNDPTPKEIAAHIALTLYALHQQSRSKPMHQRGPGIGRALRRLLGQAEPTIPPDPVTHRFQVLVTADSLDELTHHARGVVQLLRGAQAIPLDYGLLADELVLWQSPDGIGRVRRSWARDFYRPRRPGNTTAATSPSDPTDTPTDPEGN